MKRLVYARKLEEYAGVSWISKGVGQEFAGSLRSWKKPEGERREEMRPLGSEG